MKRAQFNLSHTNLLSCDMGELVPIATQEVLPGDTVQQATSALVRCSPLLAPVMHPVNCVIHHWFVPYRIIWDEWEDFITGGSDGNAMPAYPTITAPETTGFELGSLADYLGNPIGVSEFQTSALPFRAYAKIFNENYRDQDLVTPLVIDTTSGEDTTTNTSLQYAPWEKDYFTTSRPWTQKGPEVNIPLTGNAPVKAGSPLSSSTYLTIQNQDGVARPMVNDTGGAAPVYSYDTPPLTPNASLFADLSEVSAASVNDLRLALALQRFEEARARYGSRYTEYLSYLGVKSSDARLQRPEYLGGGKQTIQFSEVLQTAEGTNPVGELRGHGIGAIKSNKYRKFFEEHGIVITLMSVKPKTIYTQGSPRMFNRRTKEDFWQRELQHIGQQEVLNKELYAANPTPDGVFGYQDRYDEYRRTESRVSGEFRSSLLNFWHFAREFETPPVLNADFVSSEDVTKTPFAVQTNDTLYVMANHNVRAKRLVAQTGKSFIY